MRDINLLTAISLNTMVISKLTDDIAKLKARITAEEVIKKTLIKVEDGENKNRAL